MEVRPRHVALFAGASIVATVALWLVIDAAGEGVALAVSVAAIVAMVASYVWFGVLIVRSFGQDEASKRASVRRFYAGIPTMYGTLLVLIAAHPWGPWSMVVGTGIVMVGQLLFTYAMTIAFVILRRRTATQ